MLIPSGKYFTAKTKELNPIVPRKHLSNKVLCYDFSTLNEIFKNLAIKPHTQSATSDLKRLKSKA